MIMVLLFMLGFTTSKRPLLNLFVPFYFRLLQLQKGPLLTLHRNNKN